MKKTREGKGEGEDAVFPRCGFNVQTLVIPWYEDEGLNGDAVGFVEKVRGIWRKKKERVHVNFAHGDEELEAIYGESPPRLKEVKKRWDPDSRVNYWVSPSRRKNTIGVSQLSNNDEREILFLESREGWYHIVSKTAVSIAPISRYPGPTL
ncbi:hypothetical protein BCR34DRAFT_165590 [Clohesyomyces aquaticus]|uniref:Berberine/berberine-like domain-containing protein n=1 Tax=Clohesyomyces aquaticus TaxID=1231657 RepID=A0A1Y1YIG4_9PLEO|nr:hypothetical protein BCR34DRAFT_165590 [Clohesyomyces aquaticus]